MTKVAGTIGFCCSKDEKTSYPLPLRVLPLSQGEIVGTVLCNVINPLLRPASPNSPPEDGAYKINEAVPTHCLAFYHIVISDVAPVSPPYREG